MSVESTEFIVLRKTPYGESSLVVAGLSRDCGRLSFMVRGARRLGRRDYPLVDLFRCLSIRFRPAPHSALHRWSAADAVADFGGLARHSGRYLCAASLARFLLRETVEGVSLPLTYRALRLGLHRLAAARPDASEEVLLPAARLGVLLTFLRENGELDEASFAGADRERFRRLAGMATGDEAVPRLSAATWRRLDNWLRYLLDAADYRFEPE